MSALDSILDYHVTGNQGSIPESEPVKRLPNLKKAAPQQVRKLFNSKHVEVVRGSR